MVETLKSLIKQPYWVIALVLGTALVLLPCVTLESLEKGYRFTTHPPSTWIPVIVGVGLLIVSIGAFIYSLFKERALITSRSIGAGIDLSRVSEANGVMWTTVNKCRIEVIEGRIEEFAHKGTNLAIVLPCNEYFDDKCIEDPRGALGAFAHRVFDGQVPEFAKLVSEECIRKLSPGEEHQKTAELRATSFRPGRCLLLSKPLNRTISVALVSTTTQRVGQGLSARISYLFDGMRELVVQLADWRIYEAIMPVLGSGHGGIDTPLALVGLLLAIAEAARYGDGSQRLKRVTIVVFRKDQDSSPEVDSVVIRRALALIGERG